MPAQAMKKSKQIKKIAREQSGVEAAELSGSATGYKGLTTADWHAVFDLTRELTRKASVDNAIRASQTSARMLELLVDCAEGRGSFKGTAAGVRRMAILDVLTIASGKLGEEEWRTAGKGKAAGEQGFNPADMAEVKAFIDAGRRQLELARAKASASDAIVTEQGQTRQSEGEIVAETGDTRQSGETGKGEQGGGLTDSPSQPQGEQSPTAAQQSNSHTNS